MKVVKELSSLMTLAWVRSLPAIFTPWTNRAADSHPCRAISSVTYAGSYFFISVK